MKNLTLTVFFVIVAMLGTSGVSHSQMAGQPANSSVSGSSWFCNSGFKKSGNECVSIFSGKSVGSGSTSIANPPITTSPSCAENGSCYGDVSTNTGKPKTVSVKGYYRKDGTYVRGHYRSK